MLLAQTIRTAFHRPIIPVAFFFGGVTFDTFTLTRIDRLSDNLILLANLTLLGVLIVLMSRADRGSNTTETVPLPAFALLGARARLYYPMAIQFLLGSLFSVFFYADDIRAARLRQHGLPVPTDRDLGRPAH